MELASRITSLRIEPQAGRDALRAVMFTTPETIQTVKSLASRLRSQCGVDLVPNLGALISGVPTISGDRVTHADETFGVCDTVANHGGIIGWIETAQIFQCDNTLLSLDYRNHAIRQYEFPQDKPGDSDASVTADKIVWTATAMHAKTGLQQPTFDGTLMVTDAGLSTPQAFPVYTGIAAADPPKFVVLSAGDGFAVLGSDVSDTPYIYDVRDKPAEITADVPPRSGILAAADGRPRGLLPVWPTAGPTADDLEVYFDTVTHRAVVSANDFDQRDDEGCGRVMVGNVDFGTVPVIVAQTDDGLVGAKIPGTEGNWWVGESGLVPQGTVGTDGGDLRLRSFDGAVLWTIPAGVAEPKFGALGYLLMVNASGKALVIDERTGEEAGDAAAEITSLFETAFQDNTGGAFVEQAGDRVILNVQTAADGRVALLLKRDRVCPSAPVPIATTPIDQLTPR